MTAAKLSPAKQAQMAVVDAALAVVEDVGAGRLAPAALESAVVAECTELVGMVAGPADPLWELQVSITRQVLGLDGIPVDELAEWLAVSRSARGVDQDQSSWMARTLELLAADDEDDDA